MSRCREIYLIPLTSASDENEFVELSCDLDDNHMPALSFHYDRLLNLEWRKALELSGVPSTRTNPPKRMMNRKAAFNVS